VKTVRANHDGVLEGVRVVGLHGHIHPKATPARRAPVLVDDDSRLLRIVEVRRDADGADVLVETAETPIQEDGELPGEGTRVRPAWRARLDASIVVVGKEEIDRVDQLVPKQVLREPSTIERFIGWLRAKGEPPEGLACQRFEAANAAVWYCSKPESFTLFERIERVAQDELFRAAQLLIEKHPDARTLLEERSWWLQRARTKDEDIYLAAAGLKRVGSPHWRAMLREGLRKPNPKDWEEGLRDAEQLLDRPPVTELHAPAPPKQVSSRDHARRLFMSGSQLAKRAVG
jgi:hypothetical protein